MSISEEQLNYVTTCSAIEAGRTGQGRQSQAGQTGRAGRAGWAGRAKQADEVVREGRASTTGRKTPESCCLAMH